MYHSLFFLSVMARLSGGVGLSVFMKESGLSKYKSKAVLKDLISVGAVVCVRKRYYLTLLGANLSVADDAAASGLAVGHTENLDYMPLFQKGF